MPISQKLLDKLGQAKAQFEIVGHRQVFTAFDAAATLKVKLGEVVKSLLVKVGKDFYLALLPADKNLDFKKLSKVLNVQVSKISIPKEKVMTAAFKVKPGAISAFGSLYKIPVVVDQSLTKVKTAVFSSGSFVESLRLKVKDFLAVENPVLGNFTVARKINKPKRLARPVKRAGGQSSKQSLRSKPKQAAGLKAKRKSKQVR